MLIFSLVVSQLSSNLTPAEEPCAEVMLELGGETELSADDLDESDFNEDALPALADRRSLEPPSGGDRFSMSHTGPSSGQLKRLFRPPRLLS